MSRDIDVAGAQRLIAAGAHVVDVLAREEYDEEHLPGAVNIPLARIAAEAPDVLGDRRPVVVYCYDAECDLSPRAAARLVHLGFQDVHDLTVGIIGWLAAGRPTEGPRSRALRIGGIARPDVPTCAPGAPLSDVRRSLSDGDDACVVLDERRVVLGIVPRDRLDRSGAVAADTMIQAPSTFRPHVEATEMAQYLHEHDLPRIVVTRADGTLVGIVSTQRLHEALENATAAVTV